MPAASLTRGSPFHLRLGAYLGERFPPLGHGLIAIAYYASNHSVASALTDPSESVRFGVRALTGAATIFLFFFHLRVFDEHKDRADDDAYHAERVLQRGLVTLRDLRVIGGIGIALEFLFAAVSGPATLVSLAIAFAFSLLMLKEFFRRDWLKRHFIVYAVSHTLVMPLLAAVVLSFATGRYLWQAPAWFWVFAAFGFLAGLNFEVSRKMKAPDDEVDGVDSYTKILGTFTAAYTVLALRVVDVGLVAMVGVRLGLSPWFHVVLVLALALCVASVLRFRLKLSSRTAKQMETYSVLLLLIVNLSMAAAIAQEYGIAWGSR
jgi:4-hydroxybenzoate polyprenyltransferase